MESPNLVEGRPWQPLAMFGAGVGLALLVTVWDFYWLWRGNREFTVSDIISAWSYQVPFLPFAMGFLVCHLLGLTGGPRQ
jgi:hypothetical protein